MSSDELEECNLVPEIEFRLHFCPSRLIDLTANGGRVKAHDKR